MSIDITQYTQAAEELQALLKKSVEAYESIPEESSEVEDISFEKFVNEYDKLAELSLGFTDGVPILVLLSVGEMLDDVLALHRLLIMSGRGRGFYYKEEAKNNQKYIDILEYRKAQFDRATGN